jgi:hypothetical protein
VPSFVESVLKWYAQRDVAVSVEEAEEAAGNVMRLASLLDSWASEGSDAREGEPPLESQTEASGEA